MSLPAKYRESVTGPVFYMLENLYTKSTDQQQAVVSAFMGWFSQKARLRPSPDLDKKIADMEKRLRRMAKNMEI